MSPPHCLYCKCNTEVKAEVGGFQPIEGFRGSGMWACSSGIREIDSIERQSGKSVVLVGIIFNAFVFLFLFYILFAVVIQSRT